MHHYYHGMQCHPYLHLGTRKSNLHHTQIPDKVTTSSYYHVSPLSGGFIHAITYSLSLLSIYSSLLYLIWWGRVQRGKKPLYLQTKGCTPRLSFGMPLFNCSQKLLSTNQILWRGASLLRKFNTMKSNFPLHYQLSHMPILCRWYDHISTDSQR